MSAPRPPAPAELSSRRIKIAVVGCGRIAPRHFEAIAKHAERMELVGVCDIDPTVLATTTKATGVKGYADLGKLLAECPADVVVLSTPSGLHAEQALACAAAGKHVITEKPMATRWEDARRMVQAFDQAGAMLFVVKQNRRNPTLQLVKRAMEKRRFGRIYLVTLNVMWNRPQAYYDSARWRGTWEFDGGAFMNQASHYIDLLDWMIGPVESVHAYTATLARNIEVEDTGVANIKWRSGALGSLNVTMLTHDRNYEGSLTIIGEKGTVRLGGMAVNQIVDWEFAEPDPDDQLVQQASYETTSVYGHGHPLYYDNVINTLRGQAEAETDGREGLKSLELIIALYLSARDGRRVALPLDY